ncbi:MAG: hypothetical protein ACPGN3_03465 [Opitutales bacterium]
MNSSHALLVKANRMLGSQLVELNLITYEALENANEKFLDALHASDSKNASLLRILLAETQELKEQDLIEEQVENHGLSPCSLEHIGFSPSDWEPELVDACYATRTIPVDKVEEVVFLASSCYLSRPVREFWTKLYGDTIVWLVVPFAQIEERLQMFAEAHADESTEAEAK